MKTTTGERERKRVQNSEGEGEKKKNHIHHIRLQHPLVLDTQPIRKKKMKREKKPNRIERPKLIDGPLPHSLSLSLCLCQKAMK